jgi:hypothetical protein
VTGYFLREMLRIDVHVAKSISDKWDRQVHAVHPNKPWPLCEMTSFGSFVLAVPARPSIHV